jgi:hypoxanthine phosphoribosyltransferase
MHVNPGKEIIDFSWSEFDLAVDVMVEEFKSSDTSHIEKILALPRGGLPLGVALSHKLDLPLISYTYQITRAPHANVLVVDDIADSGETLQSISKELKNSMYYVIHYDDNSIFQPDFSYVSNKGCWISYPWESKNV